MKKEEKSTLKEEVSNAKTSTHFTVPKFKTVTIITINPIDPSMWKYAEQETAQFYELLKKSPELAFTHIFTNIKVEIKNIQIEV